MRTSRTIATISRAREEALLSACDEGDLNAVRESLQSGANMNMICESGRTPFCSAAHSGNMDILRAMIDHATSENRGAEASATDTEYSTDSDESVEEEPLPGDKGLASNDSPEGRDTQNSQNGPCQCGEMDCGATSEPHAENTTPPGSPPPAYEPRYYSNILRRNQRIKLLPYEIQVILNSFAVTDDRNGVEEYDSEEIGYDTDYDSDRNGYDFDGFDYGMEEYGLTYEDDTHVYVLATCSSALNHPEFLHRHYDPEEDTTEEDSDSDEDLPAYSATDEHLPRYNATDLYFPEFRSSNEDLPPYNATDEYPSIYNVIDEYFPEFRPSDEDLRAYRATDEHPSGYNATNLYFPEFRAADYGPQGNSVRYTRRRAALDRITCRENGPDGNDPWRNGPDGNDPWRNGPDGNDPWRNGPDGNDPWRNGPDGNDPRRNAPDEDGFLEYSSEEDVPEENAAIGALGGIFGPRDATDEDFSLGDGSDAEDPDVHEAVTPASDWRSGIFTKSDCLTHKIPNPKSLNKKDHFGCTAVHYATMGGHSEALKLLIEAGCKVNEGDVEQLFPIHMAAARGSSQELNLLIQAGARIDVQTTDKITPLHVAASRGFLENVKILIQKGARVNCLDSVDRSPLYMAVSRCHKDVVSYLICKGAKLNTEEIHGYTPLYEAVTQQNLEILRILIAAGAKLTHSQNLLHHAVIYKNEDVIKELIDAGCLINAKEESGDTALIIAAKTLQPRIVKLLLENGALVNIKNPDSGESALVQMTKNLRGKWDCFEKIFSLLLQYDLEIDGETGYKALHYAIYNAEDAVAALLIRRGAIVFKNKWDVYAQLATDLFLEALLRENRLLMKLLVYAGYNFRSIRLPDRISPSLLDWLRRRRSKPLKLSELCRIVVRSKLKNKVFERVSFLNIPSSVQRYIKLENIT